jgi:hypothetical protein
MFESNMQSCQLSAISFQAEIVMGLRTIARGSAATYCNPILGKSRAEEEALKVLRHSLRNDPANLDLATRYWKELANCDGHDVRTGSDVIEAFRSVALQSNRGVIALAQAYRELFLDSGEGPRVQLFDDELIAALRRSVPDLPESSRSEVQWILQSIGK